MVLVFANLWRYLVLFRGASRLSSRIKKKLGTLQYRVTSKTCPTLLDARVFRPGRIETWIAVPPPDAATRAALGAHYGVPTRENDTSRDIRWRSLEHLGE